MLWTYYFTSPGVYYGTRQPRFGEAFVEVMYLYMDGTWMGMAGAVVPHIEPAHTTDSETHSKVGKC